MKTQLNRYRNFTAEDRIMDLQRELIELRENTLTVYQCATFVAVALVIGFAIGAFGFHI